MNITMMEVTEKYISTKKTDLVKILEKLDHVKREFFLPFF